MRVAVLHNLPPGGAHRRLEQQLRHVDGELIEICLGDSAPVTPEPQVVPYRPLARDAASALRPPLRYLDLAALTLSWRRAARALRRAAPDVVFANPCRFLRAPAGLIGATAPSLYFCDEPHLPASDPAVRASRNRRSRHVYAGLYELERRLDRRATLQATRIATNSHYTARQIYAVYERRADVLPMGVPDHFTAHHTTPQHLLSVGSLLPDKGHDLVLRAAAAARQRWPVVVVAPRPDRAAATALNRFAGELGIELEVRTGISDQALVETYRRAYATLYLAREEPFGLASLEAQACGSPVIVTDRGGLPETLLDGITGWAVPRDPAAAAAQLDTLADAQLRARMTRAAAEHGGRASWARAGAALNTILHELHAASRSPQRPE